MPEGQRTSAALWPTVQSALRGLEQNGSECYYQVVKMHLPCSASAFGCSSSSIYFQSR